MPKKKEYYKSYENKPATKATRAGRPNGYKDKRKGFTKAEIEQGLHLRVNPVGRPPMKAIKQQEQDELIKSFSTFWKF